MKPYNLEECAYSLAFLDHSTEAAAENCLVLGLACSSTPVCLPTSCSSPSCCSSLRWGLLLPLRYYWAPTLPLPGQRQPLTASLPLLTFRRSEISFGEGTAIAYGNKNSSVWYQLLQCLPSFYQGAHIRKKCSQHRTVGPRPHMLAMTPAKVEETTKTPGRNPAPSGIVTIGQ